MAAGIDAGAITPETTFVDTGSVTLNTKTIRNWDQKAYGKVTMAEVLERSINTGAVFVQRTMGREVFREYMERFGFLRSTEADLFGEISSDISRLNPEERDVAFATASYGHGVAVTPLALTNAVSSLANGGNLMRPYVNELRGPSVLGNTVRRQTAVQVADMMISAVDKATVAKIEGYSLAGKTGTAFVPDFVRGGYTENVINTYVGFGPVSRPHFTILIKLDEPEGAPVAALTVVPAFRELAQFLLNYYDIPPDRLEIEN
jgi:cell division protein FtsI (penicillin-binding protein 3)/stage V sporulation protein D (sporulation-specific penicillin-binding protein)